MTGLTLAMTVLTLIAFAIADATAGLKTGVILAITLSLIMFGANWALLGYFDPTSLIEPFFFIVLGLVSLRLKSSIYFKFQPVAVNVITALLLAGFQISGQPLLVKWAPAMDKLMPPEYQGILMNPKIQVALSNISHALIYVLLAHALWVAYVALKKSTWHWVAARLLGYPLVIGTAIAAMMFT